jgi:hypothetical protein
MTSSSYETDARRFWDAMRERLGGILAVTSSGKDPPDRVHKGAYRALPSRRVYIPKPDGRQRPLAVAALEDKIVQRATIGVLNRGSSTDILGVARTAPHHRTNRRRGNIPFFAPRRVPFKRQDSRDFTRSLEFNHQHKPTRPRWSCRECRSRILGSRPCW